MHKEAGEGKRMGELGVSKRAKRQDGLGADGLGADGLGAELAMVPCVNAQIFCV
jgi:hypothetical protein